MSILNPGPDEEELDAAQARMNAGTQSLMSQVYGDGRAPQYMAALAILHMMSIERTGPWWKRIFSRWWISDEPLRNDAGRLLRKINYGGMIPKGYRRVGG